MGRIPPALALLITAGAANLAIAAGPGDLQLDYDTVARLAGLPLRCYKVEYPSKLGQVLESAAGLQPPSALHPVFHGCFDWHSAVHGHWLLARAAALFPGSELAENVTTVLRAQLTAEGVAGEMDYFHGHFGETFERTYGWAWLLRLQRQLDTNARELEGPDWAVWAATLRPLSSHLAGLLGTFLSRLAYPVRQGEHPNTAFGLALGLDYARAAGEPGLEAAIVEAADRFFSGDRLCPLAYEPGGTDFLSPCLQEASLMARLLPDGAFRQWSLNFLPQLFDPGFILEPGLVADPSDGKLVHLDGLNFSRAWALYRLARALPDQGERLRAMADSHVLASMEHVVGSDYAGSHWLATFLLLALEQRAEATSA